MIQVYIECKQGCVENKKFIKSMPDSFVITKDHYEIQLISGGNIFHIRCQCPECKEYVALRLK